MKAKKLESMLEFMCTDVYDAISSNLDLAKRIVKGRGYGEIFADFREVFNFAAKDSGESLHSFIEAASLSDVFLSSARAY